MWWCVWCHLGLAQGYMTLWKIVQYSECKSCTHAASDNNCLNLQNNYLKPMYIPLIQWNSLAPTNHAFEKLKLTQMCASAAGNGTNSSACLNISGWWTSMLNGKFHISYGCWDRRSFDWYCKRGVQLFPRVAVPCFIASNTNRKIFLFSHFWHMHILLNWIWDALFYMLTLIFLSYTHPINTFPAQALTNIEVYYLLCHTRFFDLSSSHKYISCFTILCKHV